ncbi:hypothetical protein Tco_0008703 [Tanacetum coccineum]
MLQTGLVHGKRNTKGVNQASKVGFKLPKGKPKLIYRPVAKPNNSKQQDNTPKENVNVACDKLNDYPIVNCGNSSSPTNDNDDLDNVMHDVCDTNVESKNKHQSSVLDSDESEVEEVLITELVPGRGFLDCLVDDLDCYDGYEAQFYDLSEQGRAFYDRYDIRLNSRCRK